MFRPVWKKCLLLAALVVAGVTLSASPAQAGWGHWRAGGCGWYGYGCYPAYVYTTSFCSPCVTSCGWSWGGSCWSGCAGWAGYSGCYSGYYGAYYAPAYGFYGGVSDCCNSVVEPMSEADAAPTPAPPAAENPVPAREPASVLPTPPQPGAMPPAPDTNLPGPQGAPPLPPAPGDTPKPTAEGRLPANATLFTVVVPEDAQVYVNGTLTKTPGTQRQFISYGLQPGYTYTYEVRALVTRNGQPLSDVQFVRVRVGEERTLAFDFGARPGTVLAARLR